MWFLFYFWLKKHIWYLYLHELYCSFYMSLLFLTLWVSLLVKGKTLEEIHKTLNIKNDFTLEEEEEVRRENQWAFEWCTGWLCGVELKQKSVFMVYYVGLYYISSSYSLTLSLSLSILSTLLLEIVSTLKCK